MFLCISGSIILAPRLFVYFLIAICPAISVFSEELEPINNALNLFGVVNIAIFFGSVINIIFHSNIYKRSLDKLKFFILFIVLVILNIGIVGFDLIVIASNLIWFANLLFIAIISKNNFTHPTQLRVLLYAVIVSSVIYSLFALYDYTFQSIYVDDGDGESRIGSLFFKNTNELSLYSLITFGIGFTIFKVSSDVLEKCFVLILMFIVGSVILLTFSVSGWLSAIVFFVARKFVRVNLKSLIWTVFLVVGVLGVMYLIDFTAFLPERISGGGTNAVRLILIWPAAIELIFAQPWLGYSPTYSAEYLSEIAGDNVVSTHNIFLGLLLNYGFLGLGVLIWFFFALNRQLLNLCNHKQSTPIVKELALTLVAFSFAVIVYGAGHNVDLSLRHTIILWSVSWATLAFLPVSQSLKIKLRK